MPGYRTVHREKLLMHIGAYTAALPEVFPETHFPLKGRAHVLPFHTYQLVDEPGLLLLGAAVDVLRPTEGHSPSF